MADQPIHPILPAPQPTGKNIVVCCDGTGNEFGASNSNVVRIYTSLDLRNEKKQVAYYHPGLGTMGAPTARNRIEKQWTRIAGLAFGAGFRDNVFDAYRFLMETYNAGDRVFLFGFSRGAYTVRALSGLLHAYGLLRLGNEGNLPYAWRAFTEKVNAARDKMEQGPASRHSVVPNFTFRETYSHQGFKIQFVGLWDTVSSIGWVYSPLRLLYTAQNRTIVTARHCVSIDERRCFFRQNLYGAPLPHQDIVQVWFPGVHSDVGGSYPADESYPSNTAFTWMLEEAKTAELITIQERVDLVLGRPTKKRFRSAPLYRPAPWPGHKIHESLQRWWKIVEFIPRRYYDWTERRRLWKVPFSESRFISPGSIIHPTAIAHLGGAFPNEPAYNPPNLDRTYLHPGVSLPFPTSAHLEGCFTYNPPPPGPCTPAQTRKRRLQVALFTFVDIVILLLLSSMILFLLASLACGLLWVLRHLCESIAQLWHLKR